MSTLGPSGIPEPVTPTGPSSAPAPSTGLSEGVSLPQMAQRHQQIASQLNAIVASLQALSDQNAGMIAAQLAPVIQQLAAIARL